MKAVAHLRAAPTAPSPRERITVTSARRFDDRLRALLPGRKFAVVHRFGDGRAGPIWSGHDLVEAYAAAAIWSATVNIPVTDEIGLSGAGGPDDRRTLPPPRPPGARGFGRGYS